MKKCLLPYVFSFGLMGFSEECRGCNLGLNRKYSKYFWGWPYGFLKKAAENDNGVYLLIDTIEEAEYFKDLPVDGIATDYIETIGPYFSKNK